MIFTLQKVEFMPSLLEPGILYVAEKYGAAAHLCPCGCGTKVRTPLTPADWSLSQDEGGPSLHPSVGNWQRPCRSHYWIRNGEVLWAGDWTEEQVISGRALEAARRAEHFETPPVHENWLRRLLKAITERLKKWL
jgi:hypothetical protein